MRYLLVSSALALLATFVALSIAAAHAYPNGSSDSWQFSKAGKTSEAGIERAGEIAAADQPFQLQEPLTERVFSHSLEILSPTIPRLLRIYHFRPPPLS